MTTETVTPTRGNEAMRNILGVILGLVGTGSLIKVAFVFRGMDDGKSLLVITLILFAGWLVANYHFWRGYSRAKQAAISERSEALSSAAFEMFRMYCWACAFLIAGTELLIAIR
jgi:hypothetical protein